LLSRVNGIAGDGFSPRVGDALGDCLGAALLRGVIEVRPVTASRGPWLHHGESDASLAPSLYRLGQQRVGRRAGRMASRQKIALQGGESAKTG
jgi:hypothetical protein